MSTEFYELIGVDRGASGARIRQAYGQAASRLARRRRALVEQGGDTSSIDLQRAKLDEAWAVLQDPVRRRRYDAMLAWAEGSRSHDPEQVWSEVSDALVHPAAALAAKLLRVTSGLAEIGQLPLAPSGAADEPPTLVPHDDDLTSPRPARLGSAARAPSTLPPEAMTPTPMVRGSVPPDATFGFRASSAEDRSTERTETGSRFAMPRPSLHRPAPSTLPPSSFKVVDGASDASDILVLPPKDSTPPAAPSAPRLPSRPPVSMPRIHPLAPEVVAALVDDVGYGGTLLATVRERLGLTVRDLADHTRISVKYLEALETEARDQLPSATFVRGYVREVARVLQLEADAVVAGYMRRYEGQ